MKIKWKNIESENECDCWVFPLMKISGKAYDEIYNIFSMLKNENGTLPDGYVNTYLRKNGFKQYQLEDISLEEVILTFNTRENHLVIRAYQNEEISHLIYVTNETIFDNTKIEQRSEWLNFEVIEVFIKIK